MNHAVSPHARARSLLVLLVLIWGLSWPAVKVGVSAMLAYVGPMATAFAYWVAVEVGRSLRATTMSMILLAVPGLGLLLSAIARHESIDVSLVLGVVLIGTDIGVVTRPDTLARRARAASGIFPLSST